MEAELQKLKAENALLRQRSSLSASVASVASPRASPRRRSPQAASRTPILMRDETAPASVFSGEGLDKIKSQIVAKLTVQNSKLKKSLLRVILLSANMKRASEAFHRWAAAALEARVAAEGQQRLTAARNAAAEAMERLRVRGLGRTVLSAWSAFAIERSRAEHEAERQFQRRAVLRQKSAVLSALSTALQRRKKLHKAAALVDKVSLLQALHRWRVATTKIKAAEEEKERAGLCAKLFFFQQRVVSAQHLLERTEEEKRRMLKDSVVRALQQVSAARRDKEAAAARFFAQRLQKEAFSSLRLQCATSAAIETTLDRIAFRSDLQRQEGRFRSLLRVWRWRTRVNKTAESIAARSNRAALNTLFAAWHRAMLRSQLAAVRREVRGERLLSSRLDRQLTTTRVLAALASAALLRRNKAIAFSALSARSQRLVLTDAFRYWREAAVRARTDEERRAARREKEAVAAAVDRQQQLYRVLSAWKVAAAKAIAAKKQRAEAKSRALLNLEALATSKVKAAMRSALCRWSLQALNLTVREKLVRPLKQGFEEVAALERGKETIRAGLATLTLTLTLTSGVRGGLLSGAADAAEVGAGPTATLLVALQGITKKILHRSSCCLWFLDSKAKDGGRVWTLAQSRSAGAEGGGGASVRTLEYGLGKSIVGDAAKEALRRATTQQRQQGASPPLVAHERVGGFFPLASPSAMTTAADTRETAVDASIILCVPNALVDSRYSPYGGDLAVRVALVHNRFEHGGPSGHSALPSLPFSPPSATSAEGRALTGEHLRVSCLCVPVLVSAPSRQGKTTTLPQPVAILQVARVLPLSIVSAPSSSASAAPPPDFSSVEIQLLKYLSKSLGSAMVAVGKQAEATNRLSELEASLSQLATRQGELEETAIKTKQELESTERRLVAAKGELKQMASLQKTAKKLELELRASQTELERTVKERDRLRKWLREKESSSPSPGSPSKIQVWRARILPSSSAAPAPLRPPALSPPAALAPSASLIVDTSAFPRPSRPLVSPPHQLPLPRPSRTKSAGPAEPSRRGREEVRPLTEAFLAGTGRYSRARSLQRLHGLLGTTARDASASGQKKDPFLLY